MNKLEQEIDSMSYAELLKVYRFSVCNHRLFRGDLSGYFCRRMQKLKEKLTPSEQVKISKIVGWEGEPIIE